MPKRIRNIVILTVLILLGFFVSKNYLKKQDPLEVGAPKSTSPKNTASDQSKVAASSSSQSKAKQKGSEENLATFLSNTKNSPQDRVYKVRDLDLNGQTAIGRKNITALVTFINSENPYLNDPQAHQPHTFKSYQLQKEASLRVYSIKRLSKSLPISDLKGQLLNVIQASNDQTIVRIAKQVLEAKEKGEDYFESMKQGIRNMKGPQGLPTEEENHTHH